MLKKLLFHILFVFLAFVAVWIMAYQKVEVFNKEDLSAVSCGWPFKFMVNDLSYRDPPFPWKITCLTGEWGNPTKEFNWQYFIIDTAFFYLILLAIYYGKNLIIKKEVGKEK